MSGIKRWDWVNQMVRGDDGGRFVKYADHEAEVARLRAEVEAYRKDAERYRWLRNDAMNGTKHDPAVLKDGPTDCCDFMFGDELDEAIDAAMGADV